jgi:hypothetical protein
MAREKDIYVVPRIIVVSFGFLLIILDRYALSPWLKFFGGFFAIYAFAPNKINPLLESVDDLLKRMKKKSTT